jgi:ankyrin repeat protein
MAKAAVALFIVWTVGVVASFAQAPPPADAMYAAIRSGGAAAVNALLQQGVDVNVHDRRGGATPLMHAAAVGSLETMRLLLDHGADVNGRSALNATALMWAVTDLAKVRLLVDRGADVNATADSGRTPLMLAAASDGSSEIVRLLLSNGAKPQQVDSSGVTTLWAATIGNDTATIRQLLTPGTDVNAADRVFGATPLMNAVQNGNLEAVTLLIAAGANVNAVSGPPSQPVKNGIIQMGRWTPLTLAATGPAPVVQALLTAGADPKAAEVRGMTPLMMSVATDHGDPATVRALIPLSDLAARSAAGETALDWALKSGITPSAAMLRAAGAPGTALARTAPATTPSREQPPLAQRAAVERGVAMLEKASGTFFANGACGACHSQNVTDIATNTAHRRGVRITERAAAQRIEGASAAFAATATRLLEREDTPSVDIALYTLAGFAAANHPPDRATDALVANTVAQQTHGGNWHQGGIPRPPIEDGDFSRTALGIRALTVYGPPGRGDEMRARVARAVVWLRSATPLTTEDRSFRLLGLAWGGASRDTLRKEAAALIDSQRRDGGFAQRPEMTSDGYATGLALYSLLESGAMTPSQPAARRAAAYLVSTQHDDGSWMVRSRALKFQPYFEGGFPYEHDQWISAMATGWSTAALALGLDQPSTPTAQ